MFRMEIIWTYSLVCIEYYVHGSVHNNCPTRSNSMQSILFYCKIALHVSGVFHIHHQEYIKL